MVKVQNWPVKDLDPGHGWIHCVYGSIDTELRETAPKNLATSAFRFWEEMLQLV